ncbi:MAG TPA: LysR substrate-binding domain-containing protein [Dongiaceae bacterium]
MRPGHLRLPPANSLVAFEATARHLSFKDAARELKVTAAALSRQIRILEEDLGCRLFDRLHRAIRLTAEGKRLQQAVGAGLSGIAATVSELRAPVRDQQVTISSSSAFAFLWLLPRIAAFNLTRPEIDVRYVVSDAYLDVASGEDVDILIRYGSGQLPGYVGHKLFHDELIAACSPAYLKRRPPLKSPADLLGERLIHLENVDPIWEDWAAWFAQLGINDAPSSRGQLINNYIIAVQAAVDGIGIVLGWKYLLQNHLRQGLLVPAIDVSVPTTQAYHQMLSERRHASGNVDLLRRWIETEAAAMQGRPA